MEATSKTTVWQVKARVMEVTGVPPIAMNLFCSAKDGKPCGEFESVNDLDLQEVVFKKENDDDDKELLVYVGLKSEKPGLGKKVGSQALVGKSPMKKYHSSKKRGVPSPELCFATGRGLRQAMITFEAEFEIFAVDKQGQFLATDHLEFEVIMELFDETGLRFDKDMVPQLDHDKSNRVCKVRYTPQRPGNYLLALKIKSGGDSLPISGSPFPVEVIDVDNRAEVKISEKMASDVWSVEMSQMLLRFSQEPEQHRRIFEEIGLPAVLGMTRYRDERVVDNLASCLQNLIVVDQNKVRMVSESGIALVSKLAYVCGQVDRPELLRFMGKVLALLAEQRAFVNDIVSVVGVPPISMLLSSNDITCQMSGARALVHISALDEFRELVVGSGMLTLLWNFLFKCDDVFLQRFVMRVLANCAESSRFEVDPKGFEKVVDFMVCADSALNVCAAHVLACLTQKSEYVARCSAILDKLCNAVTASQMRFDWEKASVEALLSNNQIDDRPIIGDTTYEYNYYFMRMLGNLLLLKAEESKQVILKNRVLPVLVHFARSYNEFVKREACRALAIFCEQSAWLDEIVRASAESGDKMAPLITLICSPELSELGAVFVVSKMQELLDTTKGRKAQAMITYMDERGRERILSLLKHPDEEVVRKAAIVLAAIVKNEQYKSYLVTHGGKLFLRNLMQLVKDGVVEVQRSVDYGEVQWVEIIGKGVSGIVWKGVWAGQLCAVKRFNEDNIAFDEEEFKSELSIMSLLRHPNIVHSLGGCTRRDSLFIIATLYTKGSLADAILNKNFKIDRPMMLQMLADAAAGMSYLHSLEILHRDLKAGNLLISNTMAVCVTDFGVSRMLTQEMSKAAGTPMYMSPEILNGGAYAFSADTYSFAFIVWEIVSRKLPYGTMNPWEITKEVCEKDLRPDPLNDPLDVLAKICWDKDPKKRPTFPMILAYLKELQDAFRSDGEAGFTAACTSKLKLLEEPLIVPKPVEVPLSEKFKRMAGLKEEGSFSSSGYQSSAVAHVAARSNSSSGSLSSASGKFMLSNLLSMRKISKNE